MTIASRLRRESETTITPTGYCRALPIYNPKVELARMPELRKWHTAAYAKRDNFHTCGHSSAAEAIACYLRYVADLCVKSDVKSDRDGCCLVCGRKSRRIAVAEVHSWFAFFCKDHMSPEFYGLALKVWLFREFSKR